MARETKAERMERQAREEAAEAELQKDAYPARLMALLERAAKTHEFDLTVKDAKLVMTRRNSSEYSDQPMSFTLSYTFDNHSNLDELEWKVNAVEQEQAEAARKYQARQAALAKLSKEERELLGVTSY